MEKIGLYIHIPFCKSKCYYCDFTTMPYQDKRIDEYFELLKKEIKLYKDIRENFVIDTIFLGGGTPTYVDSKYLLEIDDLIRNTFKIDNRIEYTIEVNPETIDLQKIKDYKKIGINRISLGVQTFNDKLLMQLGRAHKKDDILRSYELFRQNKFNNISLDLIMGLPEQSIEDIKYDLQMIKKLSPEHLSYYDLIIEGNTRFNFLLKNRKIDLPTEDDNRLFYNEIIRELKDMGLNQYEISNFSSIGFESKHNLKYWNVEKYIGIGIGSSGYIYNTRYTNTNRYKDYKNKIEDGYKPVEYRENLTKKDKIFEKIIMNMRLVKGISLNELNEKYGYDILEKNSKLIDEYINLNMIVLENGYLRFLENGFNISNKFFVDIEI